MGSGIKISEIVGSGIKISKNLGIGDQNLEKSWDQGSKSWPKIRDQGYRKTPRYYPDLASLTWTVKARSMQMVMFK